MVDEKKLQQWETYIAMAERLGVDTSDQKQAQDLVACLEYCTVSNANPKMPDAGVCDKIGISIDQLHRLKTTQAYRISSKIVLAEFMADDARRDARNGIFMTYADYMIPVLVNVAKRAAGEPFTDESGKSSFPHVRDQIAAATLFLNNPIATAWLNNTFVGETTIAAEQEHLQLRQKLAEQTRVLRLDDPDIIEGEAVPVTPTMPLALPPNAVEH